MDFGGLGGSGDLRVVGFRCSLFDDPEKSVEVNNGKLLVPWANDSDITIDRFDCRGYLQDISEYDADNVVRRLGIQSAEDEDLEEMCNNERYLELQAVNHEVAFVPEEGVTRETETSTCSYSAVGFSYDEIKPENQPSQNDSGCKENVSLGHNHFPMEHDNEPYICPPDLVLPSGMILPDSERQAAIVEKTAAFIARNNVQMEIVLKTKQSKNPQFSFLNYDDKLNPFYKELVRLIRAGRYYPRHRPTLDAPKSLPDPDNDNFHPDEPYELKLPKIDISETAYASLINRFKKSSDDRPNPDPDSANNPVKDKNPLHHSNQNILDATDPNAGKKEIKEFSDFLSTSEANYERCYQEYYQYYYSHYYIHFSNSDSVESTNESWLVAESARAAATAASAAVNAMQQSQLASKRSSPSLPSDLRGIIDKMAEYVARNGEEFQEVVRTQKQGDARFAFLQIGHIHHDYYLAKKKEFAAKHLNGHEDESRPSSIEVNQDSKHLTPRRERNSPTAIRNKGISFRLAKSVSSSRLKGMEESSSSPNSNYEDSSSLPISSSCTVLPGMSNYSFASDSEEEEKKDDTALHISSPSGARKNESVERFPESALSTSAVSLPTGSHLRATGASPHYAKSPTSPRPSQEDINANAYPTTISGSIKTLASNILTPEEIAHDIQSMEEQARLQLERRKRAALFAAKLQQAKSRKVERQVKEKNRRTPSSSHHLPPSLPPPTATAVPPPPPSSVPAAVAHAVVAQLKTQREKTLEVAVAIGDERRKAHSKSKSPPAAYARRRRRSSTSPSDDGAVCVSGGSSRNRKRPTRSVSRDRDRSHGRRRHQKRLGRRV